MSVQHLPILFIRLTAVCGPVCYLDVRRAIYANVICKTFLGGKKVRNTLSNREKELQRHGLEKEKPERFCPSLHCLFIYSISVAHWNCSQMMVWHWFDCSQILFRGLSLLGISRGKEIQTLILSLYMRIRRI